MMMQLVMTEHQVPRSFYFFGETSDNQQGIAIAVHESTGSVTKHEQHTRCSHAWPGLKSVGSGQQKRRHTCVSGS